jgi:glyoxylase-like metal-dependent hydrolase (beta-lactamase superfamily II)
MLRRLVVGQLQTNCYVMGDEKTKKGIVIDPGDESYRILDVIEELDLDVVYILLTHGHFDHTGAADELRYRLKVPIGMNALDRSMVPFEPDMLLKEGDMLKMGRFQIRVIHVPGHSPGSLCYFVTGALFCGDVLFMGSVGRTDFPGGSHQRLIQGITTKLLPLGDHVRVYPGHGPATTMGRERALNPFLQ